MWLWQPQLSAVCTDRGGSAIAPLWSLHSQTPSLPHSAFLPSCPANHTIHPNRRIRTRTYGLVGGAVSWGAPLSRFARFAESARRLETAPAFPAAPTTCRSGRSRPRDAARFRVAAHFVDEVTEAPCGLDLARSGGGRQKGADGHERVRAAFVPVDAYAPMSMRTISGGAPSRTGTKLVPSPPDTIMCRPLSTMCP
jgi:hypothetical protein